MGVRRYVILDRTVEGGWTTGFAKSSVSTGVSLSWETEPSLWEVHGQLIFLAVALTRTVKFGV